MVPCVSVATLSYPLHAPWYARQTLSALRFGERCSNIVNRAALSAMSVADAIQARVLSFSRAICASISRTCVRVCAPRRSTPRCLRAKRPCAGRKTRASRTSRPTSDCATDTNNCCRGDGSSTATSDADRATVIGVHRRR